VTVEPAPKEVGTFEISCSKHCGRGHGTGGIAGLLFVVTSFSAS
jgi:heme/copper-type cytochrome/quinol oxidase subunit 2